MRVRMAWMGRLLVVVLALAGPAQALPFTDRVAFESEVASLGLTSGVVDFEAIPDGTLVSGQTLVEATTGIGIVLPAFIPDPLGPLPRSPKVVDRPSLGGHVLGADDPGNYDALIAGTTIALSFTDDLLAFGLTIFSAETPGVALLNGDLELAVGGGETATLAVVDRTFVASLELVGGGMQDVYAYFLGVTSTTPFTSATLQTPTGIGAEGAFFYVVDDFQVAVPEPGTGLLVGVGLAALWIGRRRGCRPQARTRRHCHSHSHARKGETA